MRPIVLLYLSLFLWGCGKDTLFVNPYDNYENWDAPAIYPTSNEVLERAYLMASIAWRPIKPVPGIVGKYYEPYTVVHGLPYSSVKEINTYLFQDVSYHTFMTAVHNPNSVLYTEDISKAPYHGVNCAPYYGSVCSSSVMFALGVNIPYYTDQIITLPSMMRLDSQVLDSLRVCDVIWKRGHVQMVFDILHQADTLSQITTFEQSGMSAHIKTYTIESFRKMWVDKGYVAYRYRYLKYSEEPVELRGFDPVDYNDDLCPSKGDRAVYRTDDTVIINIFNRQYDEIVLEKDDKFVLSDSIRGDDYTYSGLSNGVYKVYLQSSGGQSLPISFEVVDISVDYKKNQNGSIVVSFNSTAPAEYVALCDESGVSNYYLINDTEREQGFKTISKRDLSKQYCKVIFRGEYGSIINRPIRIE